MPAKQQAKQSTSRERQERQQLNALIGQYVIQALGQPGDLYQVQVRHLWEDRYRVNILVGVDAASVKVAHSYFVMADAEGNVLEATPSITQQYEPVVRGRGPSS